MYLVACGVSGFGDWILEIDKGRPLGMSTARLRLSRLDSRREEEDECFSPRLEWCLDDFLSFSDDEDFEEWLLEDDLWEDDFLSLGTSRMFRTRPVVGSVVEDCAGSWDTW
jgi:hypothetical protein